MKKTYYTFMYEVTDAIMWQFVNDRDRWGYWWNASERYRKLRDNA